MGVVGGCGRVERANESQANEFRWNVRAQTLASHRRLLPTWTAVTYLQ